jgi:murein DD-endopeptidase MepM/ murein hydrolase activator NlpD
VPEKTKVLAVCDGVIKNIGESDTLGNYIIYELDDSYEIIYGHLKKILVKENSHVKKNQVIALSGNTGLTTGPHLHYSIKYKHNFIDPINFIK